MIHQFSKLNFDMIAAVVYYLFLYTFIKLTTYQRRHTRNNPIDKK